MGMVQRAWLSVWNRKGRSVLLWATVLVICNLVLAGFVIQRASAQATAYARQRLGGSVTLSVSPSLLGPGHDHPPPVTAQVVARLARLRYVVQYNYFFETLAVAKGFRAMAASSKAAKGTVPREGNGSGPMPQLALQGDRLTDLSPDFTAGTVHLVKGHAVTPQDAGRHEAVVSEALARLNDWTLGSTFTVETLQPGAAGPTLTLTVVGMFTVSPSALVGLLPLPAANPQNTIFTDYQDVASPRLNPQMTPGNVDEATFYLDDPSHIKAFIQAVHRVPILHWPSYALQAHDAEYQQMVGPINTVASFAREMVIVVAIAGALMLGLIVLLLTRERTFEVGIWLSLGERRWRILAQLVLEMVAVAAVAFGAALLTGNGVANTVANNLLRTEVQLTQQSLNTASPGGVVFGVGEAPPGTASAQPISHVDTHLTARSIEDTGLLGLLIVVLGTALPAAAIVRLRPRDILTRRE